MKKMTWTRIGLSAGVLSLLSAGLIVACTGDDEGNRSTPGVDSGTADTSTDSPSTDAAKDTGPAPKNVTLALVHAVANLGAVHACYAIQTAVVGDSANGNKPVGPLLPGIVGLFNAPIDLSKADFTPFLIDSTSTKVQTKLAAGKTCPEMVSLTDTDGGADALVEGVDYFRLPKVAAGTLLQNKTFILAATGCSQNGASGGAAAGGAPGSALICGPNFDAGNPHGNIELIVRDITSAAPAAGNSGVQFAHLAAEISPLSPFVFVKNTDDAGTTFQPVGTAAVPYQSILPVPPAAIKNLTIGSEIRISGGADASTPLPVVGTTIDVTNGQTQAASVQLEAGAGYWATGSNYSYIIVGGPTGGSYNPFPDGGYVNNHAAHLLVVKTTP